MEKTWWILPPLMYLSFLSPQVGVVRAVILGGAEKRTTYCKLLEIRRNEKKNKILCYFQLLSYILTDPISYQLITFVIFYVPRKQEEKFFIFVMLKYSVSISTTSFSSSLHIHRYLLPTISRFLLLCLWIAISAIAITITSPLTIAHNQQSHRCAHSNNRNASDCSSYPFNVCINVPDFCYFNHHVYHNNSDARELDETQIFQFCMNSVAGVIEKSPNSGSENSQSKYLFRMGSAWMENHVLFGDDKMMETGEQEHHELKITLLELLRIWIWPEANYDVFSHQKRTFLPLPSPFILFCQPTERYVASDDADDSVAPSIS